MSNAAFSFHYFLGSGLQTSPSKHAGYSVRMENAVPIVTQAAGAQPLQIQPGLLAQVNNNFGPRNNFKELDRVVNKEERFMCGSYLDFENVHDVI